MSAFRGPFSVVSTSIYAPSNIDTPHNIFQIYLIIFTIFFFFNYIPRPLFSPFADDSCLFTDFVLLRRFSFGRCPHNFRKSPHTFSVVLSPPFREIFRLPRLQFGHKFACTCEASEFTFLDEAGEGCTLPCAAARPLPCFLPFSLFPFRPSILGLFGVLLQTSDGKRRDTKIVQPNI